jgi:hypothetical protein
VDEGVHGLRSIRGVGVDGVGAQPGPRRAVGAELLATGQAVSALDPLGAARRQQHGDVVAGLGMTGGHDLAVDGRLQDPPLRRIAGALELGGGADPVAVHRHRQRGCRCVLGQAPLAGGRLGQVEAPTPEVHGHGGGQVADIAQLGEVVMEVRVGLIEFAGSGPEALQHVGRQLGEPSRGVDGGGVHGGCVCHGHVPSV